MGTKGRDAALWLLFLCVFIVVLTGLKCVAFLAVVFGFAALWQVFIEMPRTIKRRRTKRVVLVPLMKWWAVVLTMGRSGRGWTRAYEIHILYDSKLGLKSQQKDVVDDFRMISRGLPGLFLWETKVPLPRLVQYLVQCGQANGTASWWGGFLLVPRFPFTYREVRSHRKLKSGWFLNPVFVEE